jgi:hypothetical protein
MIVYMGFVLMLLLHVLVREVRVLERRVVMGMAVPRHQVLDVSAASLGVVRDVEMFVLMHQLLMVVRLELLLRDHVCTS